jgi:hypothetical protein
MDPMQDKEGHEKGTGAGVAVEVEDIREESRHRSVNDG